MRYHKSPLYTLNHVEVIRGSDESQFCCQEYFVLLLLEIFSLLPCIMEIWFNWLNAESQNKVAMHPIVIFHLGLVPVYFTTNSSPLLA